MKGRRKTIQEDLKKKEEFEDKICKLISTLYQERQILIEREKKVLYDRFISATQGKSVILVIDRDFLSTISTPPSSR